MKPCLQGKKIAPGTGLFPGADFLVNILEGNMEKEAVRSVYSRIFRTERGRELCRTMYLQEI